MRSTWCLLALAISTRAASASECAEGQAICLLQEEGARLFVAGDFAGAAAKFKASLTAIPSARAYLGYAQSLEGLGQLALGYDMIVEAKQRSDRELAASPDDVDVK